MKPVHARHRLKLNPGRRFALIPAIIMITACYASEADSLASELESGATLRALTAAEDSSVVVLLDPAECFSCINSLSAWAAWSERNPGRFHLVFTRAPSAIEERQLRLLRLHPDGHLSQGRRFSRGVQAKEWLIVNGRITLTATVVSGRLSSPVALAVNRDIQDT